MTKASIHDRITLERLYPKDMFNRDSRLNAEATAVKLHGVKILSACDANGEFQVAPATRHVAERNPEGDVVFLFPQGLQRNDRLMLSPDYGGAEPDRGASPEEVSASPGYEEFIDRVFEAARSARFKPAIGSHEERLKGFHGG